MNLCCSINPFAQCKHCRAKVCKDCLKGDGEERKHSGRYDCVACKWVCIMYSYPLRYPKAWPNRLIEVHEGQYADYYSAPGDVHYI